MSLEGQVFDRWYRIQRSYKTGGMSHIYLAIDTRNAQQVAIKISKTPGTSHVKQQEIEQAKYLFRREARAIQQLSHPNILPLRTHGEKTVAGTTYSYIIMPFCPEGSLTDWVRKQSSRRLPLTDVAHLLGQAAAALQHAHNRGIFHRDVKPSNFLISTSVGNSKRPKLLLSDFGIAKINTEVTHTKSTIRGTPTYMAPEHWQGNAVAASDQYALGVMAYQLLTGHPPFEGDNDQQLMYHHFYTQPHPPSHHNPTIPRTIDSIILRALEKNPADRFSSVAEFARCFQEEVQKLHPKSHPQRSASHPGHIPSHPERLADLPLAPPTQRHHQQPIAPPYPPIVPLIARAHRSNPPLQRSNPGGQRSQPGRRIGSPLQVARQGRKSNSGTRMITLILGLLAASVGVYFLLSRLTSSPLIPEPITPDSTVIATDPYTHTFIIARDDPLHNNSKGLDWEVSTDGTCRFIGNVYHVSQSQPGMFTYCRAGATNLKDFACQVEEYITQGDQAGIIFRFDSATLSYYYFDISTRGYYRLLLYQHNQRSRVLLQGFSLAIRGGLHQSNLLAVVTKGGRIDLYVNKQKIASTTDSTLSQGKIGLVAYDLSNPTDVVYSDIQIWN